MIGNQLGAGNLKEARADAKRLITLTVGVATTIGLIAIITSKLFPMLYNTTESVRNIAATIIIITAAFSPVNAFVHACYFTIRSGGKTYITFLFDSVFEWIICVPVAFVIASYTDMHIFFLYFIVQMMVFIKAIIGGILVSKGVWVHNLTD
jgi:Na+-driven multidrug efflux pump